MKTMNTFQQMRDIDYREKLRSNFTVAEMLIELTKQKRTAEIVILNSWFAYLEKCRLTKNPDPHEFNELVTASSMFFDNTFNINDALSKAFYATLNMLMQKADSMHKALRTKKIDLYRVLPSVLEYMRCRANMQLGHYVYFDKNIFIGYRPCLHNKPDELFVFVKQGDYYSFDPTNNKKAKISLASIKKAKKAVKYWKGGLKVGFCYFPSSFKLCELLGLQINRKKGEVRLCRHNGAGF